MSVMSGTVRPEPEHISFSDSLPDTPVKREQLGFEYECMMSMNMVCHGLMGSLTPSSFSDMFSRSPDTMGTSYFITPTQTIPDSGAADTGSPWSCANDSPISFFPHRQLSDDFETFDMDRHSQTPTGSHLPDHSSPNRMHGQRNAIVDGIQQKSTDLQRSQIRSSTERSIKPDSAPVDVVYRAMCKCDYPGCHKTFRRNEHLKRHKQTFHGEGPNRFSCEFCGKDRFNRQDNLANHRRLHARPNSRGRGVRFMPTAVPVIEQEERSRKPRVPKKPKAAEKRVSAD